MKPTVPMKNRPGRSKWAVWLVLAGLLFVLLNGLLNGLGDFNDKAKANEGETLAKQGGDHEKDHR